jgi:hypothetical protein
MKLEITLEIDERKSMPYWSAKAIHEGKVFIQVVSQTFDDKDDSDMSRRFHNVCVRTIKELTQRIPSPELKVLFIHNQND